MGRLFIRWRRERVRVPLVGSVWVELRVQLSCAAIAAANHDSDGCIVPSTRSSSSLLSSSSFTLSLNENPPPPLASRHCALCGNNNIRSNSASTLTPCSTSSLFAHACIAVPNKTTVSSPVPPLPTLSFSSCWCSTCSDLLGSPHVDHACTTNPYVIVLGRTADVPALDRRGSSCSIL